MGTRTTTTIIRIVDADTLLCLVGEKAETIRLLCVDTEESKPKLKSKPVTNAGLMAYEFALWYWSSFQPILEFETNDSLEICLINERDYFGRLRCYLWRDDENYNLKLVQMGLSPYFKKYGSSLYLDEQFNLAQESAQLEQAGIWNPNSDPEAIAPNYLFLIPWWNRRAAIIDQWRTSTIPEIWDCTKNCDNVCHYIRESRSARKIWDLNSENNYNDVIIFCDIQATKKRNYSVTSVYRVGWKNNYLSLIIKSDIINQLIDSKYSGNGIGYCYIRGIPVIYRNQPQLCVIEVCDRPSDFTNVDAINIIPSLKLQSQNLSSIRDSVRRFKDARNL